MRDIYLNKLVDITDPSCEFIQEFDKEIKKYGAIVYNYASNSYQFIRRFTHIDCKKEVLPDFIKVEASNPMLNAMQLTIHYEFDPETEDDEENLDIWNSEISKITLPVFAYDEDGEYEIEKWNPIDTSNTTHTVWFLSKESYDFILDADILMITPIIKNINIARELIRKYGVNPFEFKYDPADQDGYEIPQLYGVYEHLEEVMDLFTGSEPVENCHVHKGKCCEGEECCCGKHRDGNHECQCEDGEKCDCQNHQGDSTCYGKHQGEQ